MDVDINTDQTFTKCYIEEEEVITPIGTKRANSNVKAKMKMGFTLMVACNLKTSKIEPPFSVFNGTKLCRAKYTEHTLTLKHWNWCDSVLGKTSSFMGFQPKHCFNGDSTIQWLECVLDVLFPGRKMGIFPDMALAHRDGWVEEYINRRTTEG